MTRITRFAVAAPLVVLLGACAGRGGIPADIEGELRDVVADAPIQNATSGWALGGQARLVDIPRYGSMQAQVFVTGLTPGPKGWHIHNGGCGNPGPVVVPITPIGAQVGVGEPIVPGPDGTASAVAIIPGTSLSRQQFEAGQFSLHIHNAAGPSPGPSIACASL